MELNRKNSGVNVNDPKNGGVNGRKNSGVNGVKPEK